MGTCCCERFTDGNGLIRAIYELFTDKSIRGHSQEDF